MITPVVQRWRERRDLYRPAGETIVTAHYEVAVIPDREAKLFIEQHHYAHSMPAARWCFGLFWGGLLVGVAVFSHPVNDRVLTSVLPGNAVESVELRSIAPDLPFIPVLQGWSVCDYWRCEELYGRAGVDLLAEPLVGVGTICRRQGTGKATTIMSSLAAGGLRLHGFGFKTLGLHACGEHLASADSLAWSETARRAAPLVGHDTPGPGRPKGHINCANCLEYALGWRAELLDGLSRRRAREQLELFGRAA